MVSDSPYDLVLEMSISCEGIQRPQASTGPDSFVVVYMRESELDDWVCVGMTEVVQNSSKPQYSTKVPVKFDFSSAQHMLFRVHDFDFVSAQNELENHSMLGSCHTEVSSLLKGNLSGARLALDTTGSLVVCIQPSIESTELINYISIVVATKKLRTLSHLGSCDAFIKVYRMNPLTARKTAVHKSEVVKSSILPAWQSFILALENFRVGTTEEEELLIEIYDSDACGDVLIGSAKMSIRDLETRPLEILVSGPDGTINGALEIFTRLVHVPNFLEFLSSGYRLNMIFVIDFAEIASIRDPHVQHHLQGAAPNATIKSVMHLGQHVHNYLIKNQLQALGCGTLTSKDANSLPIDVLPLFSADDKDIRSGVASCLPSHICNEVRILLQKYERTVTRCTRAKRTIMTPVIRAVTHLARAHPQAFTIVPIITFGEIDDWNDMVEAILDADLESLSFLFIDLGNSCKLGELFRRDGDYVPLVSQKDGRVLRRSMIQYFQYRIHAQSLRQLTKDIMREIPNMCAQWGLHTGSLMQIQS